MQRFLPALAWTANASTEIATRVGGFADQASTVTRKYAPLFLALMTPVAITPFVFAAWCLGADLGVTADFPARGMLSRWLIWAGLGAVLQIAVRAYRKSR